MIILDTNIVSEGFRARPDAAVQGWLDSQPQATLFLCAPVLAELWFGVERLAPSKRRVELERMILTLESEIFPNRILSFDRDSAREFGRVVSVRKRSGQPIAPLDAVIASIALCNGMALATRDVDDFSGLGIELVNPFELRRAR